MVNNVTTFLRLGWAHPQHTLVRLGRTVSVRGVLTTDFSTSRSIPWGNLGSVVRCARRWALAFAIRVVGVVGVVVAPVQASTNDALWDDVRSRQQSLPIDRALANPQGYVTVPSDTDPVIQKATREWGDGATRLFTPGKTEVLRCRPESDPTCRAVQVLDRGFPERPTLDTTINVERDALVKNAQLPSEPSHSTGGCSPLTLTLPASSHEEVCRPGATPQSVRQVFGAKRDGELLLAFFGCVNAKTTTVTDTCTRTREVTSTTPTWTDYACPVPTRTSTQTRTITTDVTLRATFAERCVEAPVVVETVTCSQKRITHTEPACPAGSNITVTFAATGVMNGVNRQLTATHTCGSTGVMALQLTGLTVAKLRAGTTSATYRSGTATYRYRVNSLTCEKGSCQAAVSADIMVSGRVTSHLGGILVYPEEGSLKTTYEWIDDCAPLVSGMAEGSNHA